MTTFTQVGYHHGRVRGINFRPDVRGNDYAKGESVYVSPLSRRERIEDRRTNTLSKQIHCCRSIPIELASMNCAEINLEAIDFLDQMENECGLCPLSPLYPLDEKKILKVAQV
jgi:hypothetical protein